MQRVLGIGGMFFAAQDPALVSEWYERHLGIVMVGETYGGPVWVQEAGPTVLAPFGPEHSDGPHIGRGGWGINFRVADLDAMVEQLRAAGIEVDVDPERYPNGRFAQCSDPEGNAVQLWQEMPPPG